MPFKYSLGARDILRQLKAKGWTYPAHGATTPQPGDLVVWWRGKLSGSQGHIGFVYELSDGMLYTIEGNHSASVAGFSYVYSRINKLLGFAHIP